MSKFKQETATRISAADIQSFALQGIERALAARCTMTELTPEQLKEISGGARDQLKEISGGDPAQKDKDPLTIYGKIRIPIQGSRIPIK